MVCRIDGRVQSVLVGGHDVVSVLSRDDHWFCQFFEYVLSVSLRQMSWLTSSSNYDCQSESGDQYLTFPDGVNNLASIGWGTRIHSLRCGNQNSSS